MVGQKVRKEKRWGREEGGGRGGADQRTGRDILSFQALEFQLFAKQKTYRLSFNMNT